MSSNEKQTRCCYLHKTIKGSAPTNLEAPDPDTGSGRTQLLGCGNWITSLLSYTLESGLKVFFLDSEIALGNGSNLQSLHHQHYKDYGSAGRMDINDTLRVASLWHSMHAISQQLSPVSGCFGIELLQADTFDLTCFQSLPRTKFFVVSEPGTQHMEGLLKHIYELYTDYVLKNPFYEMEIPIRCELFDINLTQAVQKDRVALLAR